MYCTDMMEDGSRHSRDVSVCQLAEPLSSRLPLTRAITHHDGARWFHLFCFARHTYRRVS